MDDVPIVYCEYEPTVEVGRSVAGYWTFNVRAMETGPVGAPPDGCVALTWRLGLGKLYVIGAHTGWRHVHARTGDRVFGVRFWPGAAAALLPIAPAAIREQVMPVDGIGGFETFAPMTRALDQCVDDAELVTTADRHLARLLARSPPPDDVVLRALSRLIRASGSCTINELAAAEPISPRQLRRRFLDSAGLSPQAFARTWRWRCAAANVSAGGHTDWTALAAEYGFSDQPHLVREFRHAMGLTPNNYARLITRIDWDHLNLTSRPPPA